MIALILKNILFYWKKTAITIVLAGIILLAGISSIIFTAYIKELADKPLKSLQTEIILQEDNINKNPNDIKTTGIILPFNLQSFSKNRVKDKISNIPNVKGVSTALVLWQFDIKSNKVMVALDVNEPRVGLRSIESFLMPGGRFFTTNNSPEVILERHFATLFGYKLGQDYIISDKNYKIVGLVDFQEQSNLANAQVFIPYEKALQIIGEKDNIVNQAFVSLYSASDLLKVKDRLIKEFPSHSIISKDNLLKNLSGLNQMFYRFGSFFNAIMIILVLILVIFIMKLHRLEYKSQIKILEILGWPRHKVTQWVVIDLSFILLISVIFALIFALLLQWHISSIVKIGPLINYNLKL